MDIRFQLRDLIEVLEIQEYKRKKKLSDGNRAAFSWIKNYVNSFCNRWNELEKKIINEFQEKGCVYVKIDANIYRIYRENGKLGYKMGVKTIQSPYDFKL